ncbi:lytic murein transglycosylase [Nocardioides sp. CBS4Y-1]|uniref:Lytic murein transglycosylase n=1 Tax=Nocardioides acrostichi TaxID=2784339 RepID=A0A930USZ5_9ACTN|nr:lytic murein transglycosylase [Nocardioides acrostichi]
MRGPRAIAVFASLLLALSLAAVGVSHLYRPERTLDLTPPQAYMPAPQPASGLAGRGHRDGRRGQLVSQRWVETIAARTGIPKPALRAYADAQLGETDGCDIGWTTLAGIGWVESQHGTIGGRRLRADGTSSRPVIGPALDGSGDFAAIRSTAQSTAWHGDPTWEHAVGPMQFLRSSFDPWATDGDGDGTADPLDLDDAAATAASYLCASGADLDTGAGWSGAVLSYNRSGEYVDLVRRTADTYARRAERH